MKKIFFILLSAIFFANTFAKTPQTISYQAVIRDNLGQLLNNTSVDVEIAILQGSENGAVVYSESRTEKTNENGLMTFAIGDDQRQSSYSLSDIDWSDGPFYLQCKVKYNQGSDHAISLTSQLMSVPYALYAERVSPNALPSWVSDEKPSYQYDEIQNAPSIPTKTSELENDKQFITINDLPTVAVPTKVSELTNDANYITLNEVPSVTVPTKVSELTNDAQYITLKDVPTVEVPTKVSELQNDKNYVTESQLPTVPTNVSAFNNDAKYITRDSLPTKLSDFENDKKYITLSEVPTVEVPTKVSELTNDANYITLNDVPTVEVPTKVSELQNDKNYATVSQLPTVPTNVSAFTNDAKYITRDSLPTKISAFTNDKKYITIEQVPANPTKVSELVNDAQYITLSEVPTVEVPTKVSELQNDKNYITLSEVPTVTVPTKVSELQNDKNYATVSQLPTVPTKVSAFTNDAKYITRDSLPTKISAFTNDKKYITIEQVPANPTKVSELVNDAQYITLSEVPTVEVPTKVSELQNDKNYITLNDVPTVDVPTKVSELQNDKNYVTASQLPTVPTNVSAFNNDAKYLTRDSIADILSTGCSGALQNQLNELSLLINALSTRLDSISTVNQTLSQQLQNVQSDLEAYDEVYSPGQYRKATTYTYNFSTQSWNYGPDIYAAVEPTDRIIYLVRHSKRGKDYSSTGGLTENGKSWAKQVGEHYVGGIAGDRTFYASTSVTRCKETSYYIAMGRKDTLISINDVYNPVTVIDGSYIVGSTSGMSNVCKYYDNNASSVGTKATEIINTLCEMTVGKKFSWFTSHDNLTIPLVEWVSNKGIDFVYNETWINFMSGVAIIVHKDKTWEVYPVRNLEDGYMDWYTANHTTED